MRLLFVADLHYSLKQFDWLLDQADGFDVAAIGGDLLDLSSALDADVQIAIIEKYLGLLRRKTKLVVCSGNHDGDSRNEADESIAAWLQALRAEGIFVDGDGLTLDHTRVTICPWWDGERSRGEMQAQLERAPQAQLSEFPDSQIAYNPYARRGPFFPVSVLYPTSMNSDPSAVSVPRRAEHKIYTGAAIAAAFIVFAGFARSYFLKGFFGTPPLTTLLHLHGIIMTLWFVLFIVQVRLAGIGRVDLHRRLGIFGGFVAVAVIIIGTMTAITGARLGHSPGPPPLVFLAIPLGEMALFALLVGLGLAYRHRAAVHKRLIVLASLSMLTPAIARIPLDLIRQGGLPLYFALTDLILLICIGVDTVKNRRLHPAFGWGFLFIFVSQGLRFWLAGTSLWQRFAGWLVG